jgi:hypothetical protein
VALGAAVVCFLIRMVGLHFGIDAPKPARELGATDP